MALTPPAACSHRPAELGNATTGDATDRLKEALVILRRCSAVGLLPGYRRRVMRTSILLVVRSLAVSAILGGCTVTGVTDVPVTGWVIEGPSLTTPEDTPVSGQIKASAGAPEGFVIDAAPVHGTVSFDNAAQGLFTYTPAPNFNGDDSFTAVAKVGPELSAPATVTVKVTPVNDAPTIASVSIPAGTYSRADTIRSVTDANDPDGDTLTFTYQWLTNGSPIVAETAATLSAYKAKMGDVVAVDVIATDGVLSSPVMRSNPVTITNGAPILAKPVLTAPYTNETITVSPSATDPEGDALTFSFRWYVNGLIVASATGASLDGASFGSFERDDDIYVEVQASDGALTTDWIASAPVMVRNSVPRVDAATLSGASPYRTNDALRALPGVWSDDDPGDSASYTYQWFKNSAPLAGASADGLDGASAFDKGDVLFCRVTPVNPGAAENDAGAFVDTPSVTIANSAPFTSGQSKSGAEDEGISDNLPASDADNDALTFTIVSQPAAGTITSLNATTGAYTYTPSLNISGSDSFTFNVSDGTGVEHEHGDPNRHGGERRADADGRCNAFVHGERRGGSGGYGRDHNRP